MASCFWCEVVASKWLSQNTLYPETGGPHLEMAEEVQIETSQKTADSDVETEMPCKTSPCIIEIQDSTTECEDEVRPSLLQKEEKSFISGLHSFMKGRGSPIERIPHLGFKQINLWMIYKAVEKLGGYDSVTARRLWKKVYDELGGSPGSTSAATCTRRHYERLVLPFERHLKGEDDKPLPPSKQRKPYKRNMDGKINKIDGRGKDTQSDNVAERGPDNVCQSQAQLHSHSSLWSTATDRPDCPHSNPMTTNLCSSNYKCPHLLSIPATSPWTAHITSATGEVISPLEKKKRMAQANLNLSRSPQGEDKERPSVIHCSQSPAWASSSQGCNLSDDSPLPVSSSSSRSPSPYSISSEEGHRDNEDKPGSRSELCVKYSSTPSSPEHKSSCSHVSKHPAGWNEDVLHASSHTQETLTGKDQMSNSAWKPIHKGDVKNFTYPFYPAFNVKSDLVPAPTSSFTKVIPKTVQLPRPAPIRPIFKTQPNRLMYQNESLACMKKLKNSTPWHYQTEKREKSRTMLQKVPPAQPTSNSLPASCVLTSYDKAGRDPHHHFPFIPATLPNRMRLPQSQLMYHHYPVSPSLSGFTGHDACPYPHPIPLLSEQMGYILPVRNSLYPHTHH